jgi:hypothetical protein
MLIDIQSMFKDIIETPQQRRAAMEQQGEQRAQTAVGTLSGAGRWAAPLVSELARQQPARSEALQRGLGGMLSGVGIERETRTPSQQLQGVLASSDTSTAAGLEKTASELASLGYGPQAAMLRQQVEEKKQTDELRRQRQENLRDITKNSNLNAQQKEQVERAIGTGAFEKADDLLKYIDKATEDTSLARKTMQVLKPNGEIVSIQTDQKGRFFNMQGNEYNIPEGAMVVEGSSLVGTPEEMNVSGVEFTRLRDSQVATTAVISSVNDMLQILEANPNINTIVSSASAFANNIRAEARAIGNATGTRAEVESLINPERYTSEFAELGIRNREMQSLVNSLAYTVAKANDPGGRLSDLDVKNAIKEIGAASSDSVAFSRVLRNVAARTARNFEIDYKTRTGQDFKGDLGLGNLPGAGTPVDTTADRLEEARRFLEGLNQ